MQCILYKIYFWKVFHMYYNLICTPMWTKNFILVKSGCYTRDDLDVVGEGFTVTCSDEEALKLVKGSAKIAG
jgi:hypothetical protein